VGSHGANTATIADVVDEVQDIVGSVSEWMWDTYAPYDAQPKCWGRDGLLKHPGCSLDSVTSHSVRGGNWASPLEVAYVALRWNEKATTHSDLIGFRCVFPIANDPIENTSDAGTSDNRDAGIEPASPGADQ